MFPLIHLCAPAVDFAVRSVRFMRSKEVNSMIKNIVLCGVGGQGTVLASKLLAAAAMEQNIPVMSA